MTKSPGVRVPKCSPTVFPKRVLETIKADLFPGLPTLLERIDQLMAKLDGLDTEINLLCRESNPEVACLEQIGGVGPITALAFVLTLEDPTRFIDRRTVGA